MAKSLRSGLNHPVKAVILQTDSQFNKHHSPPTASSSWLLRVSAAIDRYAAANRNPASRQRGCQHRSACRRTTVGALSVMKPCLVSKQRVLVQATGSAQKGGQVQQLSGSRAQQVPQQVHSAVLTCTVL